MYFLQESGAALKSVCLIKSGNAWGFLTVYQETEYSVTYFFNYIRRKLSEHRLKSPDLFQALDRIGDGRSGQGGGCGGNG